MKKYCLFFTSAPALTIQHVNLGGGGSTVAMHARNAILDFASKFCDRTVGGASGLLLSIADLIADRKTVTYMHTAGLG